MPAGKHTHSRIIDGRRYVWDVAKLWPLAAKLPVKEVPADRFRELDIDCWFGKHHAPTIRKVIEHCRRIQSADLSIPVILDFDGSLMDGGHRVARALLEGRATVRAVQFPKMPPPDAVEKPE